MTHNPDQNISLDPTGSEDTVIFGERGREIPEDILVKAREVTNKLHCFMPEGDEIVAMTILAERERCAKVADEQAADWLQGILKATESFGLHYGSGRRDGAIVIAKAIRGED